MHFFKTLFFFIIDLIKTMFTNLIIKFKQLFLIATLTLSLNVSSAISFNNTSYVDLTTEYDYLYNSTLPVYNNTQPAQAYNSQAYLYNTPYPAETYYAQPQYAAAPATTYYTQPQFVAAPEEPGFFASLFGSVGSTLRDTVGSTNEDNFHQISDRFTTSLESQAVSGTQNYINEQANELVNQSGWGRTEISLSNIATDDVDYAIKTIQPLHATTPQSSYLTFVQGSLNSGENAGETRATLNLGIGQRYLLDSKQTLVGVNLFTDFESSSKHQRASVGFEFQRTNFRANANAYFPITDKVVIGENTEEALGGYDIKLSDQVPYLPWMRLKAELYGWDYNESDDVTGVVLGTEISLTKGTRLEVGFEDSNNDDASAYVRLSADLDFEKNSRFNNFRIANQAFANGGIISLTDLNWVERSNKIRVEVLKNTTTVALGEFNATTLGATCTLYNASGVGLGTATTNSTGQATLANISLSAGLISMTCEEGTYTDEATTTLTNAPTLRAATIYSGEGALTLIASPLSEIAYQLADDNVASTIAEKNTLVATAFGLDGINITSIIPTDLNDKVAGDDDAGKVGLVLAAISQMGENAGEASTSATTSAFGNNLITELKTSISNNNIASVEDSKGNEVDVTKAIENFINGTGENNDTNDANDSADIVSVQFAIDIISAYAADSSKVKPTVDTYLMAAVTGVTDDNLGAVNIAISAVGNSATVDTTGEIQTVVSSASGTADTALTKIANWAADSSTTANTPSVQDYIDIGVIGVTSDNLTAINVVVAAKNSTADADTTAEVQALADTGIAAYADALAKISNWEANSTDDNLKPTVADYENVGVTGVTTSNLSAVNSAVADATTNGANTTSEIQTLVNSASAIVNAAISKMMNWADSNGTNGDVPTIVDYENAGVSRVTVDNLASTNAAMALKNASEVNTTIEIQAIVDGANVAYTEALQKIIDWATSDSNNEPLLQDYLDVGVTGVNSDNVVAVSAMIDTVDGVDADTTIEIQALADVVITAIAKIATWATGLSSANLPTETDYVSANISGVTATNLETVNSVMAEASEAASDTSAEIQALIDSEATALGVIANWGEVNSSEPTQTNYNTARITNVSDKLVIVNLVMSVTSFAETNTRAEIQTLVDVRAAAISVISNWAENSSTTPTVTDYDNAGVDGVNSDNLSLVNGAVSGKGATAADSTLEIQNLITDIVGANIAAIAKISNWGNEPSDTNAPTLTDYNNAEVTGVNADNLVIVNLVMFDVNTANSDTKNEIQTLVDVNAVAISRIAAWDENSADSNEPTLTDYANADITDVDGKLNIVNLMMTVVNSAESDSRSEIQTLVSVRATAIDKIAAWDDAGNSGEPTLSDYFDAMVAGVNEKNLSVVNEQVRIAVFTAADTTVEIQRLADIAIEEADITKTEADAIIIISTWGEINSVEPREDDYEIAGITGVTVDNVVVVNLVMADATIAESDTKIEIQALVDVKVPAIAKIINWAEGSGIAPTLDDYTNVSVAGVTSENLTAMNNAVLATGFGDDVDTTAEIQALVGGIDGSNSVSLALIANWDGVADATSSNVPTATDYVNIGVTGADENNLITVNSVVAEATFDESDTAVKVQSLVDVNVNAISIIAAWANVSGASGTEPTLTTYVNADVINVTESKLSSINSAVALKTATDLDTRAEIQILVDDDNKNTDYDLALAKISSYENDDAADNDALTQLTLADFEAVDVNGVDATNLTVVNAVMSEATPETSNTTVLIQSLVNTKVVKIKIIADYAVNPTTSPKPTLSNYADAGVTGVEASNEDIVNAVIADESYFNTDSRTEIQTLVSVRAAAIVVISNYADTSSVEPTFEDYVNANVTEVHEDNVNTVNRAIKALNSADADTTAEIQTVADSAIKTHADALAVITAWANTSGVDDATAPAISDYADASVTDVDTTTDLDIINSIVAEKTAEQVDSRIKIQVFVDTNAVAISKISTWTGSSNEPTQADYITAGLTTVDGDNFNIVSPMMAEATTDESNTRAEIDDLVVRRAGAIIVISEYAEHVITEGGTPTVTTYADAQITGVTAANLTTVNEALKSVVNETDVDTRGEIQAMVNSATADQQTALAKIANWGETSSIEPTQADYITAGIINVDADSLETVNSVMQVASTTDSDTAEEIQVLVDGKVVDILIIANATSSTALDIVNYTNIGVTGVDSTNLETANSTMADATFVESNTVAKIQDLIDVKVAAIILIANYSAADSDAVPSRANYADADVNSVDSEIKDIVNTVMSEATFNESNTTAEIQALVDGRAESILIISLWADATSNAEPTLSNYEAAGITGLDETQVAAANNTVAATTASGADSRAEIQILVDNAKTVSADALAKIAAWDGSGSEEPTLIDYENAGVTGVTADNLASVNSVMAKTSAEDSDTVGEIQGLIEGEVISVSTIANYNDATSTVPTVENYVAVGAVGVTEDNLATINAEFFKVSVENSDTNAEITALVVIIIDALNTISAWADSSGTNGDVPNVAHYNSVGVSVSEANLTALNATVAATTAENANTLAEIQALLSTATAAIATISAWADSAGINSTTPSVENYIHAGVTGVDSDNLASVNTTVAAAGVGAADTTVKIQALID
jgi:hypothetical protein